MTLIASQITSLTVVYSAVYSDADQRKHQSSVWLAFVWRIHRDRWIPRTKGQLRGKCFHLMTSSWNIWFRTVQSGRTFAVYSKAGAIWCNMIKCIELANINEAHLYMLCVTYICLEHKIGQWTHNTYSAIVCFHKVHPKTPDRNLCYL